MKNLLDNRFLSLQWLDLLAYLRYTYIIILIFCASIYQIADKRISELEATRDLSKIWLHVDMDAFYAAVETICDPSLKGKPMAVGGMSMISTANYEVYLHKS